MDESMFPVAPKKMWEYITSREMQEIVPGLYLGPFTCALKGKIELLQTVGITHIICVRQEVGCDEAHFIQPNFPEKFEYLVFDIADSVTTNIIPFLPKVKSFIDECFSHGGKVLVHGNLGISRSASLVIGYIMESHSLSFRDACTLVQKKRFCVKPNEGFAQQLQEYEPIYKANKLLLNGQTSQITGMLKRRFDEVDELETSHMELDQAPNSAVL